MKIFLTILIFLLLTVLTQVGGLIFLLSFTTHKFINSHVRIKLHQRLFKAMSFLAIYIIATMFVTPFVAKSFGRVALPLTASGNMQPLNIFTCLLNRHYVRDELRETAIDVARQMSKEFPGTKLNYLDAGFPFLNGFPLFPHLSHNDGKKLDLAFYYTDRNTGLQTNECPSFIGYGISEEAMIGEENTPAFCDEKGNWQYSLMTKIIPQGNKSNYEFDKSRTKALVNLFANQKAIGKIFIEPHLKARLKLSGEKIRFHGCQAVRHDDHIHVQLK